MGQNDPKVMFLSSIVTLDDRRRFKIPKSMLEGLSWQGSEAPRLLMAEIVAEGHLRLWDAMEIATHLDQLEAELLEESGEPSIENEAIRVLHDRFRQVSLRPSDGRVQLSEALHLVVEPTLSTCFLYVELGRGYIDVLSAMARMARLKRHTSETFPRS